MMALLLEICRDEQLTLLTVTHDRHIAEMFPKRVYMQELNDLLKECTDMKVFSLLWSQIWHRKTLSLLTICSVAITAALVVFLLFMSSRRGARS